MMMALLSALRHLLPRPADEVNDERQATRDALAAEVAAVRESAEATQRESSRMGRELVRVGATLTGVQTSLADIGAGLQRLEAGRQAERESIREREQQIREEVRGEMLADILATLDGLEAAMAEAQAIARALAEVGRDLDDETVRRWWRAMAEASGIERPLPAVPAADVETWVRGLALTYRRLRDALERRGVTAIPALGRPFDPYLHEAVGVIPCLAEQEGIVLREERRGYRAADRVVRLAQVVVGAAALAADEPAPAAEGEEDSAEEETNER